MKNLVAQEKTGKVVVLIILALLMGILLFSGVTMVNTFKANKGTKHLFVNIDSNGRAEISSVNTIQESFEKGGYITVNPEILSKIDPGFSNVNGKYAVEFKDGKFYIMPAILNFIGEKGWEYQGTGMGGYLFVKRW